MFKMKIKLLLLFTTNLLFLSCGSYPTQTTSVNPHTEPHAEMHNDYIKEENQEIMNKQFTQELAGTYLGMIPCADCEKIIYRLQLNSDNTYQSKITYQGKSEKPIIKKGVFTINDRLIIQLDKNAGGMNLFKRQSKGLLLLDKNGKVIEGDLADKYYLLPIVKSSENTKQYRFQQILQKKGQEGIDFYAFGNEPFWSLDMDFEKVIRFKNLDGLEFNAPAVAPVKAMDANVSRYRSVTESGEIIVQLNQTECTDSMSGKKFDYSVSIDLKMSKETDYTSYKGCGNYVPDYRLHDIWAITEVDGITIKPEDFKKVFPRLEINIGKESVSGNDGCNSFNGSVKTEYGKLIFGNLASTMMACFNNVEISSKISKILSNKILTYKIANNLLTLSNKEEVVMVLKHID